MNDSRLKQGCEVYWDVKVNKSEHTVVLYEMDISPELVIAPSSFFLEKYTHKTHCFR